MPKKIIRQGVFETNSSSSHSLVIKKKSEYFSQEEIEKSLDLDNKGKIKFWREEDLTFERFPFRFLYSPYDKLKYLCATYAQNKDVLEEIVVIVKEIVPGCKGVKFPNTEWDDESKIFYGEIDHQSIGILDGYLENNNISFKEFLLNKRYSIVVDGDEYGIWDTMKESGVVNIEEIEMEIPDWNDGSWDEDEDE